MKSSDDKQRAAEIEAMIFHGEPFTFSDLHGGNDDKYRMADRLIQKHRKLGRIVFQRIGLVPHWTLTDAGMAEKARRDGGANG